MKMKTMKLITISAALVLSAQLALADDSKNQSGSKSKSYSTDTIQSGIHASKLVGADVKTSNGEKYGKLEDVILDPQTGKATFAIIGKGGILRLGEKRLPVPWQALSINSEKQVTLNMDPQKLESAPTLQSSASTELDNPEFVVVIYKFYDLPASGAGESPGGSQSGSSRNSQTDSDTSKSQPSSDSSKSQANPDTSKP